MGFLRNRIQSLRIRLPSIKPIRGLLKFNLSNTGRNNKGNLVMFHRGGGLKVKHRLVDFKRILWNVAALVLYNEYDPKRNSFLALVCYSNGIFSYVLSTEGMKSDDIIKNGNINVGLSYGNFVPLMFLPEGSRICCLEANASLGGKFARSAGTYILVVKKLLSSERILLRLPSKEEVFVNYNSMGLYGRVSRSTFFIEKGYKAGINRLKGRRPTVRGVARNPVDHPHGGGGGRCLVTLWSKIAKNSPTKKKKSLNFSVVRGRKD